MKNRILLGPVNDSGLASRSAITFSADEEEDARDFDFHLEVVKVRKNKTRNSRARRKLALFSGCKCKNKKCKRLDDVGMCVVEIFLCISIGLILLNEAWQLVALGKEYRKSKITTALMNKVHSCLL